MQQSAALLLCCGPAVEASEAGNVMRVILDWRMPHAACRMPHGLAHGAADPRRDLVPLVERGGGYAGIGDMPRKVPRAARREMHNGMGGVA